MQPGQILRPDGDKKLQTGRSHAHSDYPANQSQQKALRKQFARNPGTAGAKGSSDRELNLSRFSAHQQQVRYVDAGDQKHQPYRSHYGPQNSAHTPNDLLLQGMEVRSNAPPVVPVRIAARAVGEGVHPDWNGACEIGIGLGNTDSRLKPPDPLKSEPGELLFVPIECIGHQHIEVVVHDAEAARHYTDDCAGLRVDHNRAADCVSVPAKAPLPVAIAEHDLLRSIGDLVRCRQLTAGGLRHAKRFQYSVTNEDSVYFFRSCHSADICLLRSPYPERLKRAVVFTEREIHGGGERQALLKARQTSGAGRIE